MDLQEARGCGWSGILMTKICSWAPAQPLLSMPKISPTTEVPGSSVAHSHWAPLGFVRRRNHGAASGKLGCSMMGKVPFPERERFCCFFPDWSDKEPLGSVGNEERKSFELLGETVSLVKWTNQQLLQTQVGFKSFWCIKWCPQPVPRLTTRGLRWIFYSLLTRNHKVYK